MKSYTTGATRPDINELAHQLMHQGWRVSATDDDVIAMRPGLRLTLRHRGGRKPGAWRCRLSDGTMRFTIEKAYDDDATTALEAVMPTARTAATRIDGDIGLVPNVGMGWYAYRRWLATRT